MQPLSWQARSAYRYTTSRLQAKHEGNANVSFDQGSRLMPWFHRHTTIKLKSKAQKLWILLMHTTLKLPMGKGLVTWGEIEATQVL